MTPTFDKIHLKFKLNGISYDFEELKEVAYSLVKEGEAFEKVVGDFLLDWLDEKPYVIVKTSGSTGAPKPVKLDKTAMVNSAIMTADFFGLQPGFSALHCLPSRYIAGKMMLVRAMIIGLELDIVYPTTMPAYDDLKHYDFCAMVPLQLQNSLRRLENIDTLIVGGAAVAHSLQQELQPLKVRVFETYGMTETVSHVAVKALNHAVSLKESGFKTLPNVSIKTDERNCLVIDAPRLVPQTVVTNDIVEMIAKDEFKILGRIDNVVNSGGVKLHPETIEAKLHDKIEKRFFIASEPDELLGEKLILVLESNSNTLDSAIFDDLDKFEIPKEIKCVPKFQETETHKIQRQKTLEAIK